MRLARALIDSRQAHLVSGEDGGWHAATPVVDGRAPTEDVIAGWPDVEAALADGDLPAVEIHEGSLLSCVLRPSKIIAIGLNFVSHADEASVAVPTSPVAFAKFPSSLTGPRADVVLDDGLTTQGDYEVELAVVIGRRTRSIRESEALSAVFGYAVANDVSARDHQFADGQWDRSKSFDTFCPLGPWVTTADEVADPMALQLTTSVNGEIRQNASTKEMVHGVARLISYLSQGITLEPGDVLLTGTPSGVGLAMTPPVFLRPGDVVRCEIDGLGALENRFVTGS